MMRRTVWAALALWFIGPVAFAQAQTAAPTPAPAASQEKRIALVIGNAAYQKGALQTPANDAGLIAQTLQAAGFDVVGARDLDGETLRGSLRDFVQKAQDSGPDTVAFIYLAGYGVQLTGENYFIPIDANIARDTDVPVDGLRVSDYIRQLAALPLKANIVVLDAARANPFVKEGEPLAGGLALMEPPQNTLIAFNAAPGTVGGDDKPPYGPYAQALAEMIRAGGLSLPDVFDRTRLRVSDMTQGAQIPWNDQKIDNSFMFFERQADAPPQPDESALRTKPLPDFNNAQDAYTAALERDTLADYQNFIAAYPDDPLAKRVRAILAARREALTWRRTVNFNTPEAYWSYIKRYPRGPHVADAHRRLAILSAALEPPSSFEVVNYDVPPPPEDEIVYVDRPIVYFADPYYDFAPPPPPPVYFLPPPPPDFVVLAPPPPPYGVYLLPVPVFVPIPVFVRPPRYIAPPRNNFIFANIHNANVINNAINRPFPADRGGRPNRGGPDRGRQPGAEPGGFGRPGITPALPQAAARRANLGQPGAGGPNAPNAGAPGVVNPNAPNAARPSPGARPGSDRGRNSHLLPGANGQPLPGRPGLQDGADRQRGAGRQNEGAAAPGPGASRPDVTQPGVTRPGSEPSTRDRRRGEGSPGAGAQPSPSPSSPSSRPGARPSPNVASRPPNEFRRPGPPPPAIRDIQRPVGRPTPPPTQFARPERRQPPPQFNRPPPQMARPQPQVARPQPPPQMARPQPQFNRPSPPPMQARPQMAPPVQRAAPPPQMRAAPPPQRAAPPPPAARPAPPAAAARGGGGRPACAGAACPPPR